MNINTIGLTGRISADPEIKTTPSGTLTLRLSIAHNVYDKAAGSNGRTLWFTVTVWGARAETLGNFLKKGMPVFVTGKFDTYVSPKDSKTYLQINATDIESVAPRQGAQVNTQSADAAKPTAPAQSAYAKPTQPAQAQQTFNVHSEATNLFGGGIESDTQAPWGQ